MTHLLDTTAILAHFLGENGSDEVGELLAMGPDRIAVAAPTWVELDTRLRELVDDPDFRNQTYLHYSRTLTSLLPLDQNATEAAVSLRGSTPGRLPLSDALIAGTAMAAGLIMVHRDAHFDKVSGIRMLRLPDK